MNFWTGLLGGIAILVAINFGLGYWRERRRLAAIPRAEIVEDQAP